MAATLYPGDLTNPGTTRESLASPALAGGFFTTSTAWEALENEHLEDGMNAKKESRKSPLGLGDHLLQTGRFKALGFLFLLLT